MNTETASKPNIFEGRVYLASNNQWKVESKQTGKVFNVRLGEPGVFHPVLQRGRHENYRVSFRLSLSRKKHVEAVVLNIL